MIQIRKLAVGEDCKGIKGLGVCKIARVFTDCLCPSPDCDYRNVIVLCAGIKFSVSPSTKVSRINRPDDPSAHNPAGPHRPTT